jgi:HAD superfamily hydrolase (TIGR01458 family)
VPGRSIGISEDTSPSVAAYLLDVDGTLLTESGAIPGAGTAIERLRRRGTPFRILTNITRRSRQSVVRKLGESGIDVSTGEVFTAVHAAVGWLKRRDTRVIAPFISEDALEDVADFDLVGGTSGNLPQTTPEVVVVGDIGDRWSHQLLNEAFRYVMDGARLLVLQRGRYWLGPSGLEIDAGSYVAALEYATEQTAVVCGKPNVEFFEEAVEELGVQAVERSDGRMIVMVGDDLTADIQGAQRAGLQGWLVRTGKFRQDVLDASDIVPDRVIASVAELD